MTSPIRFNLKAYRKKQSITQSELAEQLGMNQGMVSYYERNWRTVKNSTILQIASALGVDPMELFMDDKGTSAKDLRIQVDFYPDDYKFDYPELSDLVD